MFGIFKLFSLIYLKIIFSKTSFIINNVKLNSLILLFYIQIELITVK